MVKKQKLSQIIDSLSKQNDIYAKADIFSQNLRNSINQGTMGYVTNPFFTSPNYLEVLKQEEEVKKYSQL